MSQSMSLFEILDTYGATVIKEMTINLNGEARPYKQHNLTSLLGQLPEPTRVQQALHGLEEQDKLTLMWLFSRGGQASFARLRELLREHGAVLPTPPSTNKERIDGRLRALPKINPKAKGKTYFENVIARLTRQGLLFSRGARKAGTTKIDWLHGKVIFLPDYVMAELEKRPLLTLPKRDSVTPPFSQSGQAATFQRDLGRMARYILREGALKLTTQGTLYKTNLRDLAGLMSFNVDLSAGKKEFDNGRLYFIRRLLPKLDLVDQPFGDDPITAVSDAYFWQLSLTERIDQCFRAWRDDGAWSELHQLHHYKRGVDRSYDAPKGLSDSRRIVLQHLKRLGSGWISLHELIEDIRDQDYGFLFEKRQYSRSGWGYYGYRASSSHPYSSSNNPYGAGFEGISSEKDGWDKVETDFINHLLAGPLFWLGLVDLGYDREQLEDLKGNRHIDAYSLTPIGEWLVGLAEKPKTAVSPSQLIVQPNFEIVVMGNSDGEMLLSMDQFADSVNESDHVSTFLLSRDSVYRGQQGNWPIQKIANFLETRTSQPIPQNVHRTLEEWGALQQRIVIRRNVRVLETAVPEKAEAVKALLEPATHRQLLPTLIVSEETETALTQTLMDGQIYPKRTPAGIHLPQSSIVADEEGRIRFTQRIPSLFVRRALAHITADAGDGRMLTAPLVKTAVAATSFSDILSLLQQLHHGPLPQPLIIRLKAWCSYFGDARQQTLTLLEFKDVATRDELVNDPEISPYLTNFPAEGRALAIANSTKLSELHALLSVRGITIEEGEL